MWRRALMGSFIAACGSPNPVQLDARAPAPDGVVASDGSGPGSDGSGPGSDGSGPGADATIDAFVVDGSAPDAPTTVTPCAGTPTFPALPMVLAGDGPSGVALGDLDGDGTADLATVNANSGDVTVARGLGNGRFAIGVSYPANAHPRGIAIADFDGDGDLDLVVASADTDQIQVLKNAGNATFGAPQSSSTLDAPGFFAIGNLDGDADVDVVTVHYLGGAMFAVAILLNDGSGAFGTPAMIPVDFDPQSMVLADMDNSGTLDIVIAHGEAETLMVLRNSGNATFMASQAHTAMFELRGLAIGDVDKDGNRDAIVGSSGGLRLLLGNGDGTFAASTQIMPSSGREVALADMDGDTNLDLVALVNGLMIAKGNGTGGFATASYYPGQYDARLALGELDGNLRPDIVLTGYGADASEILLNDGNGGVRTWARIPVTTGIGSLAGVASADFDLDGDLDVAVLKWTGANARLYFLRGDGTGAFTNIGAVTTTAKYAVGLIATDLDTDGRADLVSSSTVYIGPSYAATPITHGLVSESSVITGDVDGNGRPDLIVAGQGFSVVLNTSNGFSAPIVGDTNPITPHAVADLDGDGKADLIASSYMGPELRLGNGDGTFQAPAPAPGILPLDVDGDGKLDLAGKTGLARGNGDGTFQAVTPYTLDLDYLAALDAADFDRDGDIDLLALNGYGSLSLLRSNGNGTFQPRLAYTTGTQRFGFALGDYNHDGFSDAALIGYDNEVSIQLQGGCIP